MNNYYSIVDNSDNNNKQFGNCLDGRKIVKVPSKYQKIHGYVLPQIPFKNGDLYTQTSKNEVVLVNGCWDTTNKIPNFIAEMHNLRCDNDDSIKLIENTCNEMHDYLINPSPRGSDDSGVESDCTDGNLSWLLNYKIHELPPVPDVTPSTDLNSTYTVLRNNYDNNLFRGKSSTKEQNLKNTLQYRQTTDPKKPPFTYTELIEHALNEKGELTVSGIYQWISEHFPFYKQNDDRWKNSVRHNLSINPHFRKGSKAAHGAGHLWTIAQRDDKKALQMKQRMQQFLETRYKDNMKQEQEAFDMELQAATASILDEPFQEYEQNENNDDNKVPNIEVEFVNVVDIDNGLEVSLDFLSPPVSKQQIVQECGLGNDFLITDLNPNTLGINLTDGEVVNDGNFYDDITLEYYELQKE